MKKLAGVPVEEGDAVQVRLCNGKVILLKSATTQGRGINSNQDHVVLLE